MEQLKRTAVLTLLLCIIFTVRANVKVKGTVIDKNKESLLGCTIQSFVSDSIFITGTSTDNKGYFELKDSRHEDYTLSVSYIGYQTQRIKCHNVPGTLDLGTIVLLPESQVLEGVSVVASNVVHQLDRQILFPNKTQLKVSSNGVSLLQNMQLSMISINTMDNTIQTVMGSEVELRINGVKATLQEIKAILPKDVEKIEYHDSPGMRYGNVGAVIDVLLKQQTVGGNVAVDASNSVSILGIGDYSASANYHFGHSSIKMGVDWERRDFDWTCLNNEFFYGDTTPIVRKEVGMKTKVKYDKVNAFMGYTYQHENDLLSVTFRNYYNYTPNSFTDRHSSLYQEGKVYAITSLSQSHQNTPSLDVYYQHQLDSDKCLYFDLVGTYIDSHNQSNFSQTSTTSDDEFDSDVRGEKYSLIGEAIYEQKLTNGRLSFGLRHTQMNTNNTYCGTIARDVHMINTETYGYGEYYHKIGGMDYVFGLGVMRTYNHQSDSKQEDYILRPTVKLSYHVSDHFFVRYKGYSSGYAPSLSNLSDVSQLIDLYQTRRGNPELESVRFYSNEWSMNLGYNMVNMELFARYSYDHKPIMEETLYENGRYIRTLANQKGFHRINTQFNLQVRPWKQYLSIQMTPFFNRYISQGNEYTHTYSNWGFRGSMIGMYGHWALMADIETSYHSLWGETLTKNEAGHSFTVSYNTDHWNLGLKMVNPFTKTYKQATENWSEAAPYQQLVSSKDFCRVMMVTAAFNLDFGKHKDGTNNRIRNDDLDAGLMQGAR